MKQYDKALEDVNQSISINNNQAESYYQRATIYWRKSIFDPALQDCKKCVEIDTNFAMGFCRISFTKLGKKSKMKGQTQLQLFFKECRFFLQNPVLHMEQKKYSFNCQFNIFQS
ncbi:unnamed protein product [Paramecium primaurelia]|uniref:Uncharacterized protein n=1 Tax=Paramecium primaurelia TaxID=5886 RepID=A0A8S1PH93_PARPR|nr:unnamed protein product [Paramecium primaurelia]